MMARPDTETGRRCFNYARPRPGCAEQRSVARSGCTQERAVCRAGRTQQAVDAGEIGRKRPCRMCLCGAGNDQHRSISDHDRGGGYRRSGYPVAGVTSRSEYHSVISDNNRPCLSG